MSKQPDLFRDAEALALARERLRQAGCKPDGPLHFPYVLWLVPGRGQIDEDGALAWLAERDDLQAKRERLRQAGAWSMSGPSDAMQWLKWCLPGTGVWVSEEFAMAWLAERERKHD